MASVRVLGVERLLARFAVIPVLALKASGSALHQGAENIEQDAKDAAPVDAGDLRDGFKSSPLPETKTHVGYQIEAEAPHTIHVEYGTSEQPAQPMMRPAFDNGVSPTISRVKSMVKGAIQ